MSEVIQWLNQNSNAGMVILTALYVVATLVMAALMLRSNSLGRQQLSQTLRFEKDRARPYIVFDLQLRKQCMYAVLRNDGLTSAKNVKLTIDPQLTSQNRQNKPSALTSHVISLITPKREISDFIAVGHVFYNEYSQPEFKGQLRYEAVDGSLYNEEFYIDLDYGKELLAIQEPDVAKELERLRKEIEKMRRSLERVAKISKQSIKPNIEASSSAMLDI